MKKIIKLEGFVLKKQPLLDKDLLVTVFTDLQGKIKVIAKGVKKITSRRLAHLESGNLIKMILVKQRDRVYLQESELISGLTEIKYNQIKINYLYLLLFIIDRLLPENQIDRSVYRLMRQFINRLAKEENLQLDLFYNCYIRQLLIDLGYLNKSGNKKKIKTYLEEIIDEKLPAFII